MSQTEGRHKRVSSVDVARLAGVSRSAVSRAFTPGASVSPETREKVYKAAKELGYRVNYLARSLINQRSDLVGLVVASMDNPFRSQQIDQLARTLLDHNFRPVLLPTDDNRDPSQVIQQLLHYNVSGVVVTSDAPPSEICQECVAHHVPIVLINKGDELPQVDRVLNDNNASGHIAADLLLTQGCRHLAVMGSTMRSFTGRQRLSAFLEQCRKHGVEVGVIDTDFNDYDNGYRFAEHLHNQQIDGLFCVNDYLACGVIDRIHRDSDLHIDSEIRVVGHDNITQAAWRAYDLTTIQQPCDIQAKQVVDLLISRIREPERSARTEYTEVHIVRRSSA